MVEENGRKRKADAESQKPSAERKLTNRQKRQKLNEKNKWPQHPKIQSMDQRAKAYIRVAGLGSSTKSKESIDPSLDLMSPEVKFGRLLGGTDQRKRHAAVNKLKSYLRARCDIQNEKGGISEIDLLKLWKGLWYTLYMADKVPVQDELSKCLAELLWCVAGTEEEDEYAGQAYLDMCDAAEKAAADDIDDEDVTIEEVANTLHTDEDNTENPMEQQSYEEEESSDDESSSDEGMGAGVNSDKEEDIVDDATIPHCRGAHLASLFIRTFFRTVRREWGSMDKYRVDKFYTLIRMYMHEVFKYMATRHWNLGIIRLFNDAIFDEVLNKTPNGLRYHLIDVTLDELAKVNATAPMQLTEATFLDTLEPYFAMCQTGAGDDTIQERVLEKVVARFLEKYSVVRDELLDEGNEKASEDSLTFEQVHVGSVAQFIFELGSDPETKDRYRKSLYEMHKTYMRQLKKAGTDVELDEDIKEEDTTMECTMEVIEENYVDGNSKENLETETKETYMKAGKEQIEIEEKFVKGDIEGSENVKKAKKKKKKRKGSSNTGEEEEVLTISLSEQKKASAETKRKGQTLVSVKDKSNVEELEVIAADAKRVQFTSTNRSKSFKASMKALLTATPPKTSMTTPEKGILRGGLIPTKKRRSERKSKKKVNGSKQHHSEGKSKHKGNGKRGRKRAVDYF
eukprot:scaffold346_cov116-Cylindrotheca_fusiformis.AAC.41